MNVTFLTGELGAKRKMIRSMSQDAIVADNDDVIGYFRLSGKLYCLPGTLPFSDMSVRSFIAYKRSLITDKCKAMSAREVRCYLKAVGCKLSTRRKVGTLPTAQYRHLCLASNFKVGATRVYLNFDGLAYTRYNKRALRALVKKLSRAYAVFVAVSDSRFIPRGAVVARVTSDGAEIAAANKQRSRTVSKRVLGKYFRTSDSLLGLDYSILKNPVLIS